MASITADQISDLIKTTRAAEGALRFQQIGQKYVFYEVFSRIFKRDKMMFQSGHKITRTLMTKFDRSAAKHVGFLEPDVVRITDVLEQMSVTWAHATTSWALAYQTDVLMNSGSSLILNILKPRRLGAVLALVEELEDAFWADPPATTAAEQPWGLKYWLVRNATTGFNGGLPGSHTTVAGIDLTATPNFKNYTGTYSAFSFPDAVESLETAFLDCQFVSPVQHPDYRKQIRDRYRCYVNKTTLLEAKRLIRSQNSDLEKDLASMEGQAYINGYPIIRIAALDSDTANPIYGVDFATFAPCMLKGDYLRETGPVPATDQHNAWNNFVDLTYNYIDVDRRRSFVFYKQ